MIYRCTKWIIFKSLPNTPPLPYLFSPSLPKSLWLNHDLWKKEVKFFGDVCHIEIVIAPIGTILSLLFYQLWARGRSTLTITQKRWHGNKLRSYRRSKSDIFILPSYLLHGMLAFHLLLLSLNYNKTGTCKLEYLTEWVILLHHTTLCIKDLSFLVWQSSNSQYFLKVWLSA